MGWRAVAAPDGRTYYYESRTRETSWKMPEGWTHAPDGGPRLVRVGAGAGGSGNKGTLSTAKPDAKRDGNSSNASAHNLDLVPNKPAPVPPPRVQEKINRPDIEEASSPVTSSATLKKSKSAATLAASLLPSQRAAKMRPDELSTKKSDAVSGGWKATKTPTGQTYYYHTSTHATRWDLPPELAAAVGTRTDTQLADELQQTKERAKTAQDQVTQLERQLADAIALREKDRAQVASLRAQLENLKSVRESSQQKAEMLKQQQDDEVTRLRTDLEAVRAEKDQVTNEQVRLKQELDQIRSQEEGRTTQIQQQLARRDKELAMAHEQLQQLQTSSTTTNDMQQQVQELLREQDERRRSEEQAVVAAQAHKHEVARITAYLDGEQVRLREVQEEVARLRAEAENHASETRRLNIQLQAEHIVKRRLNERLAAVSSEIDQMPALQSQIVSLSQQLDEARNREKQRQEQWASLERAMRQQLETVMHAARQAASERDAAQTEAHQNFERAEHLQELLQQAQKSIQESSSAKHNFDHSFLAYPEFPEESASTGVTPGMSANVPAQVDVEPSSIYQPVSLFRRPIQTDNQPPPPPAAISPEEHFALYPWFHGRVSGAEAESLLAGRAVGSFLIRFSSQPQHLAVSYMWAQNQVQSALIGYDSNDVWKTDEPDERFPDLPTLINSSSHILTYPVSKSEDFN